MSSSAALRNVSRNHVSGMRPTAARKGAAPPLHRTTTRPVATATFVRPPRNPSGAVHACASCSGDEAPDCAGAGAGAAVAGVPAVSEPPAPSQDREVSHNCDAAAPAAQPVYRVRGVAAMSPAALVEAFRATCKGHVVDAACTAQGKTLLQAAVRTQEAEVLDAVVAELCPRLCDVAVDAEGCHVLRALVEACTAEQTEALIGAMHASVVLNMCTTSQYTRRTLQSLFERREVDLSALVRVLADNAGYLAATQQGCISLMRVFELCDAAQKAELVRELLPKLAALSMDAFANYMVQCAVEHSDRATAAQYVVAHFAGNILRMSCNKHSSNVLEAVLRCCGDVPAVRRLFLDELVFNPAALKEVVGDLYGNFVVQTLIGVVTNPMEFKRLEDRLRPALAGCQFAPKIEGKLRAVRPAALRAGGAGHRPSHSHYHSHSHLQQARLSLVSYPTSGYRDANPVCVRTGGPCPSAPPVSVDQACVSLEGCCARPYESIPYSCLPSPAEQQSQGHMGRTVSGQAHPAEYFRFPILGECTASRAAGAVPVADEANCGPVYGPSPQARHRLQQQQQQQAFRQPFNIVC